MAAIIGEKIGMTRVFGHDGTEIPVTLVKIGKNYISQIKTGQTDGYWAIQLVYPKSKKIRQPQKVRYEKAGIKTPVNFSREIKITEKEAANFKIGQEIELGVFSKNQKIWVKGVSKGKGFAGVIKRHGFHRGPTTHGSDHHRAPGSIGSMFPQRVLKGKKMPGHLGGRSSKIHHLEIIDILPEERLIMIKGPVPGPNRGLLLIGAEDA